MLYSAMTFVRICLWCMHVCVVISIVMFMRTVYIMYYCGQVERPVQLIKFHSPYGGAICQIRINNDRQFLWTRLGVMDP